MSIEIVKEYGVVQDGQKRLGVQGTDTECSL